MHPTSESQTQQAERSVRQSVQRSSSASVSNSNASALRSTVDIGASNNLTTQSQRQANTTANNNFGVGSGSSGGGSQARAGTGRRVRSKSQADIVLPGRRQDFFFTPSPSSSLTSFSLIPSLPPAELSASTTSATAATIPVTSQTSAPTAVVVQSKSNFVTASSTSKRSTSSPQLVLLPRTRSNTGNSGNTGNTGLGSTGTLPTGKNPSLSASATARAPFVSSFDFQPTSILYPPPPLTGWTLSSVPPHVSHAGTPHISAGMPMEQNDSEDERDDDVIYVSRSSLGGHGQGHNHVHAHGHTSGHVRSRKGINARRREDEDFKLVTTARGQACAGETETELEDVPTRLPIARKIPEHPPLIPLPLDTLVPYLFEFFRLLSIVPAVSGTLYNIHNVIHPPSISNVHLNAIDYLISALWAILTGLQCLALTTGLLSRWKAYYATLSTLIRLLALQAICWPATHFTLLVFDHVERPLMCWVIIGTTTCFSRSIQLWVTSNLLEGNVKVMRGEVRYGPRRWNWAEVGKKCVLPAGVLYFVSTWALLVKDELRNRILL